MSRHSFDPEQRPWMPLERSHLHPVEQQAHEALAREEGRPMHLALGHEKWANDEYQVTVLYQSDALGDPQGDPSPDGVVQLSIRRDKQAIKNEICGPEREAIEIYPAESRLVDGADSAHLWVMPTGAEVPFGFPEREVTDDRERRREMRVKFGPDVARFKGSQRNWRPGIPTGKGRSG
jgi:hypothetical protein